MKLAQTFLGILALLIIGAGELQAQKDLLDKIQPKEPSYVRRGNQAYEDGRFSDAMTYYMKALEHAPESNRALFNLGDSYYQKARFDTAANAFSRVAARAGSATEKADAFYNAGNAHFKAEQYDKAISSYLGALQANPEHVQARKNLAYAIKELQQQQQQQQQQGGDKQKQGESEDSQSGEQEEQQDGSNSESENQQEEQQENQNEDDPQSSDEESDREGEEKTSQDQKTGDRGEEQNLNKEQMEALLDRLRQKEQQTLKGVQKRKRGNTTSREKDW